MKRGWLDNLFLGVLSTVIWLTVTLPATSGVLYLWRNRRLYLDDM